MSLDSLFNHFDKHLKNLDIFSETEELFVVKVVENYLIEMHLGGFTMGEKAEDIYMELTDQVDEMLKKTTYGYFNLDAYRNHLRNTEPNNKKTA